MLVNETVIQDDGKGNIIKHVTYERLGTAEKVGDVDAVIREIAYVFRHSQHKIIKMVIEHGKNILYTQVVQERKSDQEGLNEKNKTESDMSGTDKL
jgi:hypothetical protein